MVLGDHGVHVEVPIRLDLLSVEKLAYHLGEDRADLIGAVGPPVAGEAVAWEGVFGLGQKETGHGRGKVTMRYRDRNASAAELRVSILTRPGQSWRDQDQRDVSQLAVEARAVPEEAVLAELLPVIGGDNNPGVFEEARCPQLVEEAAELGVEAEQAIIVEAGQSAGDNVELALAFWSPIRLADVQIALGTPAHFRDGLPPRRDRAGPELSDRGGRWNIRTMDIHEVHEEEERPERARPARLIALPDTAQPVLRMVDQLRREARVPRGNSEGTGSPARLPSCMIDRPSDELNTAACTLTSWLQSMSA